VLHCVAVCDQPDVHTYVEQPFACQLPLNGSMLQYVAVCCSVVQCVAVCCSALQCVAVCCSVLQCVAVCCSVLQSVAVYCTILQCVINLMYIHASSNPSHANCR